MRINVASIILFFYFFLIILFILLFIFIPFSDSSFFDYARITDVDYKAILIDEPDNGGKVRITERLTFDIHAASKNNLYWELWRDLCEDNIDGLKVDYKVNYVKQIFDDKPDVVYQESPKLYWDDSDYLVSAQARGFGPGKWYHSKGPYNESLRRYECVLFYVNGLYREKPTFEIEYEMNNAAFRYGDCSELYLCMFSEDSVNYLNSFKGHILIPNENMPREGNYFAYTYGTNSNRFDFTKSTSSYPGYHAFEFDLDKSALKFNNYNEYIEFLLVSYGDDKHIFTQYAPSNLYSNDEVLQEIIDENEEYEEKILEYTKGKLIVLILCLICSFILIKRFFRVDDELEQKYNIFTPTIDMDYFRDIPSNLDPLFASTLAFCRHNKKNINQDGYAAIILSLARKKYIELEKINNNSDWSFKNVKIVIKDKPVTLRPDLELTQTSINEIFSDSLDNREPLSKSEELYFKLIQRYVQNSEISMSSFQTKVSTDYDNTNTFVKNLEQSTIDIGVSQGYFQKADYTEPERKLKTKSAIYLFIAILILVLNFISAQTRLGLAFGGFLILSSTFLFGSFIFKYLSKKYLLLTKFGEDEYVKWKGLYNFLNSETLINERTVVELPLWEKYLVYATAFGISKKVIKALNIRCSKANESPILSNPYYRSRSFYSSSRSFVHSTHMASYVSNSGNYSSYGGSGYSSFYGGIHGGGRGGGGGGGGH